jgi:hypothetical protein
MSDETETTTPQQSERAEQLARLFHDVRRAITGENSMPPFDSLPDHVREYDKQVADRIIREGWIAPELMEKARREHSELLDLYFDMMKTVGVEPDADFKSGPAKAKELASVKRYHEQNAKERWAEIHRLRAMVFELTGDNAYLAPGRFKEGDPGEVKKPEVSFDSILDFAASELYDAAKGYTAADAVEQAATATSAAQAMLEIKQILKDPMKMVETLVGDRDMWQRKAELLEEDGAVTTAALGQAQEALIDLTRGHDKMIRLLERVAVIGDTLVNAGVGESSDPIVRDIRALLNSGDVRVIEL